MADYYYGVNKGKNQDTAAVGTSTNSTDVEIRIKDTVTRQEALNAVNNLINYILTQNFPPA